MSEIRGQSYAVTFLALSALASERVNDGYLAFALRSASAALYMPPRPERARSIRREVRALLADLRRTRRDGVGDADIQREVAEVARAMLFEAWCLRIGNRPV